MTRRRLRGGLLELGSVRALTRGGPMGYEDSQRTYWVHLGLSND